MSSVSSSDLAVSNFRNIFRSFGRCLRVIIIPASLGRHGDYYAITNFKSTECYRIAISFSASRLVTFLTLIHEKPDCRSQSWSSWIRSFLRGARGNRVVPSDLDEDGSIRNSNAFRTYLDCGARSSRDAYVEFDSETRRRIHWRSSPIGYRISVYGDPRGFPRSLVLLSVTALHACNVAKNSRHGLVGDFLLSRERSVEQSRYRDAGGTFNS